MKHMKKFEVTIREVILHKFVVEEFNDFMAKEAAIKLMDGLQSGRVARSHADIIATECGTIQEVEEDKA